MTRRRHRNQLLTSGAEQCRRVAAQCLPDREVYVLLTSQGALPEWGLPGAVAAFGRCLDVEAMGWFKQRGQWRGRGSALWIDDLTIVDAIKGNLFDPSAERWYFETLLGAVVHESAHAIISGVGEEPADAALLEHAAIVREASVMVETSRDQGVPWAGHGVPFLRAAFHLRFRDLAGRYLPIARVADTAMYGLGLAHPFWTALVPEMESAAEKQTPIAEVLREPPPAAFADRWRGGVAAWAERQEQLTKRQLRHVVAALRLFSSEVT